MEDHPKALKESPPPHGFWDHVQQPGALVAVALMSAGLLWGGWQYHIVAERKAAWEMIQQKMIDVRMNNEQVESAAMWLPASEDQPPLPWYRTLLGDVALQAVVLNESNFSPDEIRHIKEIFPEATVCSNQEFRKM